MRQAELFVETEECCGGLFPYNSVAEMETTSDAEMLRLRELGFSEELSFLSNYNVNGAYDTAICLDRVVWILTFAPAHVHNSLGSIYGLGSNYSFAGDTTICTNTSAAEQLIFGFDQDAEVNWWDFWIKTGLIASIFVPVLITNLGLSVHGLADPLSQCAGEYEVPSNRFLQVTIVDGHALRQRFERGLWTVSVKWCFIWFVLVKLCLLNLMMASNIGETLTGANTEASIVQVAFFVVVIGGCIGAFLLALTILANRRRLVLELTPRQASRATEETRRLRV